MIVALRFWQALLLRDGSAVAGTGPASTIQSGRSLNSDGIDLLCEKIKKMDAEETHRALVRTMTDNERAYQAFCVGQGKS